MAISRYNRPAELNLIDTYVPLPFKEIKASIDQKQNTYDVTEETFEKTPSILDSLNVHQTWEDSYGNTIGRNIGYDVVEAKKKQIRNTQQALFDKYQGDWSKPEAQKEIRAFANSVAGWYENTGKPLQNKSAQYLKEKDEASKKKNELGYQNIYKNFNDKIYKEVQKGNEGTIDADWQSPTYSEYLDKSEAVNKAATNIGSIVKEWSGGRKTNLNDLTAEEYKTFRKTNASQIQTAKNALLSQLNQKHSEEAFELARQQANQQGVSPEELYNTEITLTGPKGNKIKTTWGQAQKQKLDQEVSSLFDAKLNIEKKDLTDYSNLSKDQLGLYGFGEDGSQVPIGYIPANPIETDLVNNKYNVDNIKSMNFQDYLKSTIDPNKLSLQEKHDFNNEVEKLYKRKYDLPEAKEFEVLDKKVKSGEKLNSIQKHHYESIKQAKEYQDKKNSIYEQFQVIKKIDELKPEEFHKKMSEINPIYKVIHEQNPDLSKEEVLDLSREVESKKSVAGVTIGLRQAEADNQWYSLFGKEDKGSFNNAKSLKWTDRETGQVLNFDNIEIDGTAIKDLTPEEIIKYKKEGRIAVPKFEYPIASIGGQSVEIDGKTYLTGGETIKEKKELEPMSILNSVTRNPLQTSKNNGASEVFKYSKDQNDIYLEKRYHIKPAAVQAVTDYKTMTSYVIAYDDNGQVLGTLPLDEYNKGTIDLISGGFVQQKKNKDLD